MRGFGRLKLWLMAALVLSVAGCAAGLWLTPVGDLPRLQLAQERWNAQHIRHYRMVVQLSHGWIDNGPWMLEIREERVLGGFDTATGAPLSHIQLGVAQLRAPISTIFAAIGDDLRRSRSIQTHLARLVPPLRSRLDRCAAPMPQMSYDPALGYPRLLIVYPSPCFINADWTVSVTELTPLP